MLTFSTRSLAEENEETQAFGNILAQGFVPTAKVGEYAFLETQHGLSDDDENGDADIEEDDRAQDVFGRVDAPELRVRSFHEAQELAVQQTRARRTLDEDEDVDMLGREEEDDETYDERVRRELSPQIHLGASSSPAAPLKLNLKHRTTTTVVQAAHVDDFADLDVRFPFSLRLSPSRAQPLTPRLALAVAALGLWRPARHHGQVQRARRVEHHDQQRRRRAQRSVRPLPPRLLSLSVSLVLTRRSCSTSFKRTTVTTTTTTAAAAGGRPGAKGGKSGSALGPRPSKFAAVRKGGFA